MSDNLAAAGQPLNDYESTSCLLFGLGTEFDSVVASLSTHGEAMSIEDLYSHLLIHEQRLEHHSSTTEPAFPSANLVVSIYYRLIVGLLGFRPNLLVLHILVQHTLLCLYKGSSMY